MNRSTKIFAALLLIVFLSLVLFFLRGPSFNTQQVKKLSIPDQTIPFVEVRSSSNEQAFSQLHLYIWDPASASWYRDEIPICEVQGGPIKVFWNGSSRIFLSPSNPRGSFRLVSQNPLFEVISFPATDAYVPLYIADQWDIPYFLSLEKHQQNNKLKISLYLANKNLQQQRSLDFEASDPDTTLVPIGHELSLKNAKLVFSFQKNKEIGSSHGIMQSTMNISEDRKIILQKVYESFYADPSIYYQRTSSDLFRIRADAEISILQNKDLGFLPYSINRSNHESFQHYLFGSKALPAGISELGLKLKQIPSSDIRISQQEEILLIGWKPDNLVLHSTSPEIIQGSRLEIAQISAIHDGKTIGRIERIGKILRFYSENKLQLELKMPDDGFKYEYISP
jgi:hypothetical protein